MGLRNSLSKLKVASRRTWCTRVVSPKFSGGKQPPTNIEPGEQPLDASVRWGATERGWKHPTQRPRFDRHLYAPSDTVTDALQSPYASTRGSGPYEPVPIQHEPTDPSVIQIRKQLERQKLNGNFKPVQRQYR